MSSPVSSPSHTPQQASPQFTPSSPSSSPSSPSQFSQASPSSPIPAFVRMGGEDLESVSDDDIVKWCCYRDDEFMEVDDDD